MSVGREADRLNCLIYSEDGLLIHMLIVNEHPVAAWHILNFRA